ncbi:MAG: hypothetical protein RL220_1356, partial [Bacteroidota bacterium]
MKSALLGLCAILSPLFILATDIPAGNVSGVWDAAGSPYVITGHIRVPAGQTLIIQPGTQVQFSGAYYLRVLGNLTAQGAAGDSITITSTATNITWRGIKMDSLDMASDTVRISHCRINKLYNDGIQIVGTSKVIVERSRIYGNTQMYVSCVYAYNGSPLIRYNHFHNNTGYSGIHGASIRVTDSNAIIEYNTFKNNTAPNGEAGVTVWRNNIATQPVIRFNTFDNNDTSGGCAIGIHSNCVPHIEGNVFQNNNASFNGGCMWIGYVQVGYVQIINNTFLNNGSAAQGGCIYGVNSKILVSGCEFAGNTSTIQGAAIYVYDECDLIVEDCVFRNNDGNNGSNIVHVNDHSDIQMNRCVFRNNESGGGAFGITSTSTGNITNCIFANNTGINTAGAVFMSQHSHPVFSNCVFAHNDGPYAGAMHLYWNADPVFNNCIFWNNTTAGEVLNIKVQDYIWHYCNPSFYNCVVQNGISSFSMGTSSVNVYENCLESDPSFVNPSSGTGLTYSTIAEDWNVNLLTSPCIDGGTGTISGLGLGEFDLAGEARLQGESLDIGAYEGGYFFLAGDLNGDNLVGTADLILFLGSFGCNSDCGIADIDGDGVVG